MTDPAGAAESGGIALRILSESFAVRALLGSLLAAALVVLATRLELVRGRNARRLLVLAPVVTAAITAAGSATYLPQLVLTTPGRGADDALLMVEVTRFFSLSRPLDVLAAAYGLCVVVLLSRRTLGILAVRTLLRDGREPESGARLAVAVRACAERMGMRAPRVLTIRDCPGGAFANGVLRPRVAVDPDLVAALDDRELEGLIAHELAHLRRRDPLMWGLVGEFRDLTFFLGPVQLASRWLHREQEESADEAAVATTHRPGALASSILKVWERRAGTAGPPIACAAVPVRRRPGRSQANSAVTQRVERLIAGTHALSPWRTAAEALLATAVIAAATTAAMTLPGLVGGPNLILNYGRGTELDAVPRSPAFTTFYELTAGQAHGAKPSKDADARVEVATCPCVESQAQLRAGLPATAPPDDPWLRWGSGRSVRDYSETSALWLLGDDGTGIWLESARQGQAGAEARRSRLVP